MESVRTIIVGAGKAGLALSYYLTQAGHEHLILERGRVAERWRSERWDSFTLLSPNWHSRLAGYCYTGPDPDGFMDRSEIVDYLQSYADSFGAPVRGSSEVTSARRNEALGRHLVEVSHGETTFEAENLVVAIGGFQRPHLIPLQSSFPTDLFQIHTNDYRNPDQLPPGAVLVVGSGTSGQQIAEELNQSGRRVFLSVGQHARLPRRYRGRDIVWWLDETGVFDQKADEASASDRRPAAALTGVGGGHDLDLRQLAVDGVQLLGHLRSVAGNRLEFAPDLELSLAAGDQTWINFKQRVDAHILAHNLEAPLEPAVTPSPLAGKGSGEGTKTPSPHAGKGSGEGTKTPSPLAGEGWGEGASSPSLLDLRAEGINSVVWCTGYEYDLDWLQLPLVGADGEPQHRRGVTPFPGLYILGLRWLWKRKSSFIDGAAEDAEYIAERLAQSSKR